MRLLLKAQKLRTFHSAQPGQFCSSLLTLTVWMQDKNGLGEAMGRQDLTLLHFTKCPAETFVSRAFVSVTKASGISPF